VFIANKEHELVALYLLFSQAVKKLLAEVRHG
jgi:hypothetical protein